MASSTKEASGGSAAGRVLKTGHLYKRGGSYRNWKKRYFILRKSTLTYFAVEGDRKPKGIIDLTKGRGVRAKQLCLLESEDWPLEATEDLAFGVAVENRTFYIYGCDKAAVNDWMTVLEERIQEVGCPSSDYTKDSIGKRESVPSKIVNGSVKLVSRRRTTKSLSKEDGNKEIVDQIKSADEDSFDSSGSLPDRMMDSA